jgi:hypothetical protein
MRNEVFSYHAYSFLSGRIAYVNRVPFSKGKRTFVVKFSNVISLHKIYREDWIGRRDGMDEELARLGALNK